MTPKPRLPVAEIFGPTLQGEGALVGQKTLFVRFAYCDGAGDQHCSWCDSRFAVDVKFKKEWSFLTGDEILDALRALSPACRDVTLSGGNPALHNLADLVELLRSEGYKIHVETQGTIFRPWLRRCTTVTVSPKPPSAGKCDIPRFLRFVDKMTDPRLPRTRLICKIVVDPDRDDDYEFACRILRGLDKLYYHNIEKYLSALTLPTDSTNDLLERYRRLADRVVADPDLQGVGVLPQIHAVLWGHRRGV